MINTEVRIFKDTYAGELQKKLNNFLATIDVRQIIKTDFSTNQDYAFVIVYFVPFEDIRDAKIDNILDIK